MDAPLAAVDGSAAAIKALGLIASAHLALAQTAAANGPPAAEAPLDQARSSASLPQPDAPDTTAAPGSGARAVASGISMHIASPGGAPVDVQLTDRAGQIHVAVRTPDPELEVSLRQDLDTLVGSLERSGFRTVATSGPAESGSAALGSRAGQEGNADPGGQPPQSRGGNGQPPPRQQQQPSRQGNGAPSAFAWNQAYVSLDREKDQENLP